MSTNPVDIAALVSDTVHRLHVDGKRVAAAKIGRCCLVGFWSPSLIVASTALPCHAQSTEWFIH